MMDLGEIHWILNMEVIWDRKNQTISLCKSQYIENILERHGMANCKPAATPMEVNLKLKNLKQLKLTQLDINNLLDH